MFSILIITGPRASGKTTLACAAHKRFSRSIVIHVDDAFHMLLHQDRERWKGCEADLYAVVLQHQLALVCDLAASGCPVIIDGTILPRQATPPTVRSDVLDIRTIVLLPPLSICLASDRNSNRSVSPQEDKVRITWTQMQEWRSHADHCTLIVEKPGYAAADDLETFLKTPQS